MKNEGTIPPKLLAAMTGGGRRRTGVVPLKNSKKNDLGGEICLSMRDVGGARRTDSGRFVGKGTKTIGRSRATST